MFFTLCLFSELEKITRLKVLVAVFKFYMGRKVAHLSTVHEDKHGQLFGLVDVYALRTTAPIKKRE